MNNFDENNLYLLFFQIGATKLSIPTVGVWINASWYFREYLKELEDT